MKNLLFVCSMILLDVMGCGSRHEPPILDVSTNTIMFEYQQESQTISVFSNVKWTVVTESGSWLDISPSSGKDDMEIIITAQPNESNNIRSTNIKILGGDIEKNIQVYQKGKAIEDN